MRRLTARKRKCYFLLLFNFKLRSRQIFFPIFIFAFFYHFIPPGECSSAKRWAGRWHWICAERTPDLPWRGLPQPHGGHHPDAAAERVPEVSEAAEVHSEGLQDELFRLQGLTIVKLEKSRRFGELKHRANLLDQLEGLWGRSGGEHPPGQVVAKNMFCLTGCKWFCQIIYDIN